MLETKLYELAGAYRHILENEVDFDELEEVFNAVDEQFETKAVNVAKYAIELSGSMYKINDEILRLKYRKAGVEARYNWLLKYLKNNMEVVGKQKIKSDIFDIIIKKNPPKAIVDSVEELPGEFKEVVEEIKVNKSLLREKLKKQDIPGAHLEQGTRIEIR